MEKIDIGKDFTQFMGEFKHEYFYGSAKRQPMDDYTEKYLYFRSYKTDIIYEFKLATFPGLRTRAMLLTSTNNDTCYIQLYKRAAPSIERTRRELERFWSYLTRGAKVSPYVKLLDTLKDDFKSEGLRKIQFELERRKKRNEKQ